MSPTIEQPKGAWRPPKHPDDLIRCHFTRAELEEILVGLRLRWDEAKDVYNKAARLGCTVSDVHKNPATFAKITGYLKKTSATADAHGVIL